MKRTERDERNFAQGVAIACSIMQAAHDSPVIISEALAATGYRTRAKLKAMGVDDYDLKILKPVFAELK